MYTNATATLYAYQAETGSYLRVPLGNVFWDEVKRVTVLQTGGREEYSVLALVPYTGAEFGIVADKKSRIAKGTMAQEIGPAYTITQLIQDYDARLISTVDDKRSGTEDMWHWEVGAK